MNGKIAKLGLFGLLIVPTCADAGVLDVLNTVQNIAGAVNDTQRTLAGEKVDGPLVAGAGGKHAASGHAVTHARRHK